MTKRAFTILIIVAVTNLPIGCHVDENDEIDSCGSSSQSGQLVSIISELDASVGSWSSSIFSQTDTNDYDSAAIRIFIESTEYIKVSQTFERGFSIINSAYACSPPDPDSQPINSIKVISDSNIYSNGLEYSSGEDLADLFKVSGYASFLNQGITVNQFIEFRNEYSSIFSNVGDPIFFQLINNPDSTIKQKLTFLFEFSDSEIIEIETPVFSVSH